MASVAKDQLAKLLAKENLSVRRSAMAQTASFDLNSRVLTLPIWVNRSGRSTTPLSMEVNDMMTGHEVGHALYTPKNGWENAITKEKVNKNVLNVVEDARIERKIKRTYPGIVKSFLTGYKELVQAGFFGDVSPSEMNIIDRLNMHFKCGLQAVIPFEPHEEKFVTLMEEAETFADAVRAAKIIQMAYTEEEWLEEMESSDEGEGSPWDNPDDFQQSFEDSDDGDDGDDGDDDDDLEEGTSNFRSGDTSDYDPDDFDGEEKHQMKDDEVVTDSTWEEKKKELSDPKAKELVYFNLPTPNLDSLIVPYKTLIPRFEELLLKDEEQRKEATHSWISPLDVSKKEFATFRNSSSKIVNYMVKEFERKKSADEYRRESISKTGVIDVNKLYSYKYNDDLFLKHTLRPDGKNHGLVMLLDWSASMCGAMQDTVKQLLNLVWFCQKVNIPFEVYAFSASYTASRRKHFWDNIKEDEDTAEAYQKLFADVWKWKETDLAINDEFALLNLFSSKMSAKENIAMSRTLFVVTDRLRASISLRELDLSSTPLMEACIAMHDILPKFKAANKLDKLNLIILTDGEGNSTPNGLMSRIEGSEGLGWGTKWAKGLNSNVTAAVFEDPITRKVYMTKDFQRGKFYNYYNNATAYENLILTALRDRMNINIIGIYQIDSHTRTIPKRLMEKYLGWFSFNKEQHKALRKEVRVDGVGTVSSPGYDEYYIIPTSTMRQIDDTPMSGLTSDSSKGQIRNAFRKSLNAKFGSRVLVDRMMNLIT